MLIAQITDLHLDPQKGPSCGNTHRLRQVIADINQMKRRPDMVVMTGDLAEQGKGETYKVLKAEISNLKMPTYFAMGNHDDRTAFAACFSNANFNEGFLQYVINGEALRVIVIDTSEPGLHGGAFCQSRANWLATELAKAPGTPTIIAMHHPPTDSGIPWLTTPDNAAWAQRFKAVINPHKNVVHIICGHIHRNIFMRFAGSTLSVASAVALQAKLELAAIDINKPDGRVLLEEANPGYALHHWNGKTMTTHNVTVGARSVLHFDQSHAHIVRETLDHA